MTNLTSKTELTRVIWGRTMRMGLNLSRYSVGGVIDALDALGYLRLPDETLVGCKQMNNERPPEQWLCKICGYTAPNSEGTPTGNPTCPNCRIIMVRVGIPSNQMSHDDMIGHLFKSAGGVIPADLVDRVILRLSDQKQEIERLREWERMFTAFVTSSLSEGFKKEPLWPNPSWPQDVAMVAYALANKKTDSRSEKA